VNDFYRRFARKNETERHYVNVSRAATILLFLLSIIVTWQIQTVGRAWTFLLAIGAGTGLVLILRWYWWRINAWSEISAMVTSFVVSVTAMQLVPQRFAGTPNADAWVMLVTVAVSTVVWLSVTFLTSPEPDSVLDAFYRRVRPGGPGWVAVSKRLGFGREPMPGGGLAWANWIAGVVAVYATLFGIGKVVFGEWGPGLILLVIAAAAFAWIARSFRRVQDRGTPVAVVEPRA
jgi:Na+/proline symporter